MSHSSQKFCEANSQITALRAFSLLEMSIVLTIIGILVTGALNASSVINRIRLANARSMTENSPVRDIAGLVAWYETTQDSSFAAGAVYNSYADSPNNVNQWFDTSPTSMALRASSSQVLSKTPSSTISYVQDGIGHLPSFSFSGGSLKTDNLRNSLSNASIFIVMQPSGLSVARDVFSDGKNGNASNILTISSTAATINRGTSLSLSSSVFRNGIPAIIAVYLSTNSGIYANSTTALLGGSAGNAGTDILDGFYLGGRKSGGGGGGANSFSGLVSEVIIFNQTLKITDRRNVMNYLSKKYKISVSGASD